VFAEPAQDREAVRVGEHDVQDGDVDVGPRLVVERLAAIGRGEHVEACEAQRSRQELADRGFVVYHEDRCLWLLVRHADH
jgi:hypothetical protein